MRKKAETKKRENYDTIKKDLALARRQKQTNGNDKTKLLKM